jgi:hypothetical protein
MHPVCHVEDMNEVFDVAGRKVVQRGDVESHAWLLKTSAAALVLWRPTFELTPTAEAGAVSPDGDDRTSGAGSAHSACRSGSGVERGVRRRCAHT